MLFNTMRRSRFVTARVKQTPFPGARQIVPLRSRVFSTSNKPRVVGGPAVVGDRDEAKDDKVDPTHLPPLAKNSSKTGEIVPSKPQVGEVLFTGLGTFTALATVSYIHYGLLAGHEWSMVLGSFGATSMLIFGAHKLPVSQPKNVICGHLIAATTGVFAHQFLSLPPEALVIVPPIACAVSVVAMQLTDTFHPPAGGTCLIAASGSEKIQEMGFEFLIPTFCGSLSLVMIGYLVNNMNKNRAYPMKWF